MTVVWMLKCKPCIACSWWYIGLDKHLSSICEKGIPQKTGEGNRQWQSSFGAVSLITELMTASMGLLACMVRMSYSEMMLQVCNKP